MPGLRTTWLWLALIDLLLLIGSFDLAFQLRFGGHPPVANITAFRTVAPLIILALPVIYFGFGLYMRRKTATLIRSAVFAEAVLFLFVMAAAFWLRGFAFPRSVLVLTFLFHFCGVLAWRLALRLTRAGHPQRVLVAAQEDEALRIVEKFLHEPPGWYEVVGVFRPADLCARGAAALEGVDVLAAGPSVMGSDRQAVVRLALAAKARVYLLPALDDILLFGAVANQIDDAPVLEVKPLEMSTAQRLAKRVFDLTVAVPLLLITAPIMAGVWMTIKLFSPGPALFTQTRVGLNGKEFTLCKFRTMVVDAEKHTGPVLATANDSRITPLGEFLRATRLDELPQLWNVIRGDMSLVGPRPERPFFVDKFSHELPDYGLRHLVPPGVTGLAQVMGTYHTSVQNKLRFDLYYVRHYSVWLDFKILLLTLQAVISKDSAAGVGAAGTSAAVKAQELVLNRSFRV